MNVPRENQNETIVVVSFASQNPERQQEMHDGVVEAARPRHAELRFPPDETAAMQALRDAEVMFTWRFTEDMFRAARGLKWIHLSGAGVDQILSPELNSSAILVTNSRGMHGPYIAEWVLGALLYVSQRFAEADTWRRDRQWAPHKRAITSRRTLLQNRRALIVGYGSVGEAVALRLHALGVACEGVVKSPRSANIPLHSSDRLPHVIGQFDIVINVLPLTAGTRGVFNADLFARMKQGSIFVNVGRGKTVDETALEHALRKGPLGYAALDVLAAEPLPETSPLFDLPNLFMTPHVSGNYPDYSRVANRIFIANFRRYINGEPLENLIDKSRGY